MTDECAVVTGAAGGIGAAVVRALAAEGTPVAALDRNAQGLRDHACELTAAGLAVTPFPVDVVDADAVESTVAQIEADLGPIRFLVNAAGVLHAGDVCELPMARWAQMIAVNTTGVFAVSKAVVARMITRGGGAIVTVASNAAATPRAGMAGYAASKAAATMFTKSLGLEVARHGIRCNVVAPGSTDTDMLRSLWRDEHDRTLTLEGNPSTFRVGIPLGRLAAPDDVAAAVLFLLSDQARHITLHDLTVDGGAALGA